MVLKRKRSESELSFSSTFSSPPRPGSSAFDFSAMETESWGFLTSRSSTPSHLPSRTMKRFRDNRPSEAEVHQRTLSLLYSAQQQQLSTIGKPQPAPVMPTPCPSVTTARRNLQQRSLHSFWGLPVTTSSPAPVATPPTLSSPGVAHQSLSICCEDCGAGPSNGSDIMTDIGSGEADIQSCGACGKVACFSCSISNLGDHRRCLACAEPGVWRGQARLATGMAC